MHFNGRRIVATVAGPREQLNQITGYLDASLIYGSSDKEAMSLRDDNPGVRSIRKQFQHSCLFLSFTKKVGGICHKPNACHACSGSIMILEVDRPIQKLFRSLQSRNLTLCLHFDIVGYVIVKTRPLPQQQI